MRGRFSIKALMCSVIFAAALVYGLYSLQLIGHRPAIIFLTMWIAVLGIGILLLYAVLGRNPKVFIKLTMVAVLLIGAYGLTEMVCNQKYQEQVQAMQDWAVDLSQVDDGSYIGESDVGYIKARVQVTVKNHVITDIDLLKHVNEHGAMAESIIDDIVAKQDVDVDTISSATNSSKVIKTAVKNALLQKGKIK